MVTYFNPLCKSHFLYLHVDNVTLLLTKNYFSLKILYISPNFGTSKKYITFHWWQKLLPILLVLAECSVEGSKSQAKSKQGKIQKQKLIFISVIFCLDTSVLYCLSCVKKDSPFDFAYQIAFFYCWGQRPEILLFQDFCFTNKFPSSSDSPQNSIFTLFIKHYSFLPESKI